MREYAAQKEIDEQTALDAGMKEKAEEFKLKIRRARQATRDEAAIQRSLPAARK